MKSFYNRFVNFSSKDSLNFKLRQRRLHIFLSLINGVRRPVRVLDIGGSAFYWEHLFFSIPGVNPADFEITICNITEEQLKAESDTKARFKFAIADARNMPEFRSNEFDIVHSNSVIEHVGDFASMLKMSAEVRRVGRRYFVQTPNFYFPVEPHFKTVGFHWLPRTWRIWLVQRRKFGHLPKANDEQRAREIVDSAQLLDSWALGTCFPTGTVHREKFFGLTKSFVVVGIGDFP